MSPAQEQSIIDRFRDGHHTVAKMMAIGALPAHIMRMTGYTPRRQGILAADPTFQELIAVYKSRADRAFDEAQDVYLTLGMANMVRSEALISDRLDAVEDDPIANAVPIATLDRISQGRADRFGYGKHATLDVNHDFAARMDKAIARSGAVAIAPPDVIEGEVIEPPTPTGNARSLISQGVEAPPPPPRPDFRRVLSAPLKRRKIA